MMKHWLAIIIAGVCFVIPLIPQLMYWKWLTGYTIYDSYGPNQQFDFLHSHLWKGLFGPSNGWLFYTPLMLFSLLGFLLVEKWRAYALGISLFVMLYIWCVYSWFLPNYINGLGSRPMVDIYPVLALPLAAFLQWLYTRGRTIRIIGTTILVLCIGVNLNYTVKKALGVLNSDDSKYLFNLTTFFRFHLTYNDLVIWDTGILQPEEKDLKPVAQDCITLKDSVYSEHVIIDSIIHTKVYMMRPGEEYGPVSIKRTGQSLAGKRHHWMRCSGRFRTTSPEYDIYQNQMLVLQIRRGDQTISWNGVRINNKTGLLEKGSSLIPGLFQFRENIWGTVSYYVPVPEDIQASDLIQLDIWNIGKKPIYISDLCLSVYN